MAKLRRAVNREEGVLAECPLGGGMCVARELARGKVRTVTCGFYEGLHEDDRGKFSRCNLPDPCPR